MRVLVVHLLSGLEKAGLERAVVTLGENAKAVEDAVQARKFLPTFKVDFVYMHNQLWRNLANSVVAARTAFPGDQPLLVLRADQLYSWPLLRKIADAPFRKGLDAFALIDTAPATLEWAKGTFCSQFCKDGRCHALAKVLRGADGRAVRCGHRLGSYDAVVAGDVYATRPKLFGIISRQLNESVSTTIADGVQEIAAQGGLGCVDVGEELTDPPSWFGSKTVAALFSGQSFKGRRWQHVLDGARTMLAREIGRQSPRLEGAPGVAAGDGSGSGPSSSGYGEDAPPLLLPTTSPLLQLGPTIGRGANCEVIEAEPDGARSDVADGSVPSRLAVKMFKNLGHSDGNYREVMWEVHVLRSLRHDHIVRLCDVVELADAVYLVMERLDGPDLRTHIREATDGPLPGVLRESHAKVFFRHVLAALRHAHAKGFLHCDLKPENIRLNATRDRAVLVDWGLAREVAKQPAVITQGTPAYAAPEQLTGHDVDEAFGGRARLRPACDVWALGCTCYEMIVGEPPFCGGTFEELVANVLQLNYSLPDDLGLSLEVRQLVDGCLKLHPSERSSIGELCTDPWVVLGAGPMPPDRSAAGSAMPNSICGECDAGGEGDDESADGSKKGGSSLLGGRSFDWQRLGLYLVYAGLVSFALVSHLRSSSSGQQSSSQAQLFEMADEEPVRVARAAVPAGGAGGP